MKVFNELFEITVISGITADMIKRLKNLGDILNYDKQQKIAVTMTTTL